MADQLSKDNPKLYILVGPPAVGKSTWVQKNAPNAMVVNRDDIVDGIASHYGLSYDEAFIAPPDQDKVSDGDVVSGFEKYGSVVKSDLDFREWDFTTPKLIQDKASDMLDKKLNRLSSHSFDVVVDMTNMTKEYRANALKYFGDQFHKVAVVFNFSSPKLIDAIKANVKKRNAELKKIGKGKSIPEEAIDRMVDSYEAPDRSEGFDEISNYDNSKFLLKQKTKGEIQEIVKKFL